MRIDVSELPEEMAELGPAIAGSSVRWSSSEMVSRGSSWCKHDAYRPKVLLRAISGRVRKGKLVVPEDFCDTPEDIIEDFYK